MKKAFFLCTITVLLFLQAIGQVPEKFNYQGILRNSSGDLVKNTSITVKIYLLAGSASGAVQYSENHAVSTNNYGQFTVQVGGGTDVTGVFASIDWSQLMFLKTEVANPTGGSFVNMGTTQLVSVPYALFSGKAKVLDNNSLYFTDTDTLFAVKDRDGNIVFAVFPDGAKVYTNPSTKGTVGGFAVSGRTPTKLGEEIEYFRVTPDSTRIYVNDSLISKGSVGGFAISGRTPTKGGIKEYFSINKDSTRIYINDSLTTKGTVGGFAVSGRTPTKGNGNQFLFLNSDSTRIYVKDTLSANGKVGGFAVGGLNSTKGESSKLMSLTKENYFIGHNAGKNNTTGKFNSIIGFESALNNTEGSDNVFLGYQCGFSNKLGVNNIFIGKSAGYNNIGEIQTEPYYLEYGSYNVFIGNNSGYNNVSGWTNCFLGNFSGYGNDTGSDNTFIGNFSGESNSSGSGNSSLGAFSNRSNTIGIQNVTIGFYSGNLNTGSSNTFVGAYAGVDNLTGQNNTIIGYYANVSDGSLFNATAIGNGAIVNASNKIILGNSSITSIGGYGNWTNYSDRRLKENIVYNKDLGLKFIMDLKTARYNFKDDANKRSRDGLIAQDVKQSLDKLNITFSGLVIDNDSIGTMNLSYSDFVVPLINAVQEQQTEINSLKSENKEFKKENIELKKRLDQLEGLKSELEAIKAVIRGK
jgi:hypothetical protein